MEGCLAQQDQFPYQIGKCHSEISTRAIANAAELSTNAGARVLGDCAGGEGRKALCFCHIRPIRWAVEQGALPVNTRIEIE
jgi:hypothetical protein